MKLYRQREWKAYCAEQIKLHGGVCAHCLRAAPEVVLQVHHRHYVKGRLPWEYPYDECDVLCRGCHAKEHGIIMPSNDWEFIGEDDLGALEGECEYCGKELRYTHMVTHPNWGTMIVGAQCCDKLTETTIGSEAHVDLLNYVNRRKTFINSPKWFVAPNGIRSIERADIAIEIVPTDDGKFRFNLDDVKGKADHATLLDAQICVFDYVESGKAAEYLAERRRKIAERKAANGPMKKPGPRGERYVEPGFPKRDGKEGRLFAALSWNEGKPKAGAFLGCQVPCGGDQQREGVKVHPGCPCGVHGGG